MKPGNLFLCSNGDLKVIDFGIALRAPAEGWADMTRLTRPGSIMGTPHYMAPEQVSGDADADERTDVWALGAVLYHCIAGRPPFEVPGSVMGELVRVLMEGPDPLPASTPEPVQDLILATLHKAPEERIATMAELEARLAAVLKTLPIEEADVAAHTGSLELAAAELLEEVRLVSAVIARGFAGPAKRQAFVDLCRQAGGVSPRLRGGPALGIFGGAEWTGDEATRAARVALASGGIASRVGVGTGKATVNPNRGYLATGAAIDAAHGALEEASAQKQSEEPVATLIGACPETRRRIRGGFVVEGCAAAEGPARTAATGHT